MSSEIECIEVPVKLMAFQFKGSFEPRETPMFVVRNFDITSLTYMEYNPETHPDDRKYYYTIMNTQTNAREHVHRMDWFVQYPDEVIIVPEVDFNKNYIQLTEDFRIMIGTVLI